MACILLTKTKKNDLIYQYSTDHERHDIKSAANSKLITKLADAFFKERKLKEFEKERDTIDILSLRVDSGEYNNFLRELLSNLASRIDSINPEEWKDLESEVAIDEAGSLQELLSITSFLRRYYSLTKNKKYKDYTYYINKSDTI